MSKLEEVLSDFEGLNLEEQISFIEVLKRREDIYQRAIEVEKAFKKGQVIRGSVEDLIHDLES
ncbi:MAG: hypothetical protein IEMM0008_0342 [bacterium]|nr:MAG: hypothetical protein IEMM0008_0342 [bacterium]